MKAAIAFLFVAIVAVGAGIWLGKYSSEPSGVVNLIIPGKSLDGASARKIAISSRGSHMDFLCNTSCPDVNVHMEVRDNNYRIGIYNEQNICIYCGDMYVDGGAQFDDQVISSGNGLVGKRIRTVFAGEAH